MANQDNSRRDFFKKTAAASVGLALSPGLLSASEPQNKKSPIPAIQPEWRNKQSGAHYRMLGKTGMMVSELVVGTYPYKNESFYPVLDYGIERGVNYLDTAAAYTQGQVESNLGNYIAQKGIREKIFLSTKLSHYGGYLHSVLRDIDKGLPQGKKDALRKKADQMIEYRGVLKPGYHMDFWDGQSKQVFEAYYYHVLKQEYGFKSEWKSKIKKHTYGLLESGLKRLKTDYVDVLHCPHGIAMPEMMDDEVLKELFSEFKQKGLIRASAVSFHNDVAGNLSKAIEVGYYDATMFAYNIANHAALENLIYKAKEAGLGMVAMKVARLLWMEDQPEWKNEDSWRLKKLNTTLPDPSLSKFAKSYLWALQNANLSCCVAQMETVEMFADNIKIMGKKAETLTV
ncbi:aldo/keto reductase [Paraglaciecola aquimarina]|uniref:Aldo/keto reductase n=1 Tax=Paraglaciecola algarum TaxID=3050085 RepID=A0ABS9D5M0_9ALTE|nr:aldo/keto reductase [Paraglaciecola sp. G1-23]MCF2947317.1 aldo/keto reductase [Paraglaciecola sp. G1-23]